jgi:hypothetical protein
LVKSIIATTPAFNRVMLWGDNIFQYDRQVLGDPHDEF